MTIKKQAHTRKIYNKAHERKNEVTTYTNKIFASKHGQRLTYILLYINELQTPTHYIYYNYPQGKKEKVGIYGETQQVSQIENNFPNN